MNAPSSRKQVGDRWNKVVLHVCTETQNRGRHRQPQEEGGVCVCERERERDPPTMHGLCVKGWEPSGRVPELLTTGH